MNMKNFEQPPATDIKSQLEQVPGVSDVRTVVIDEEYLQLAKDELFIDQPELVEKIKEQSEHIDAYTYKYLSDGLSIRGYLWVPKGTKDKLPLVMWNRGGVGRYSQIGDKRGTLMLHLSGDIARMGVAVAATEYRGGGYDSEGVDEPGGADLRDVTNLKDTIEKLPIIKEGKKIVVGICRGGMVGYMLAAREDWVKGIVSLAGIADLSMDKEGLSKMEQKFREAFGVAKDEEIKERSATHFYNEIPLDLPILMLHGDADDLISVEQARKLYTLLKDSGHDVEYHEYPGAGHRLLEAKDQVLVSIEEFIKENTQE